MVRMGFTCILYTNTFPVGRYWDFKFRHFFTHKISKNRPMKYNNYSGLELQILEPIFSIADF